MEDQQKNVMKYNVVCEVEHTNESTNWNISYVSVGLFECKVLYMSVCAKSLNV